MYLKLFDNKILILQLSQINYYFNYIYFYKYGLQSGYIQKKLLKMENNISDIILK